MPSPSLDVARRCWSTGDLAGADRECEALLAQSPGVTEAWLLRSRVALMQGRRPEAGELLAAGYEATRDPTFAGELTTFHVQNREPAAARRWLREWESGGADRGAIELGRGLCDWLEGEHAGAVEHFHSACRLNPGNPRYPLRLARALVSLGRTAEAAACLGALPPAALGSGGHELLALCTFDLSGHDEALAIVRRGLGHHPDSPDLNFLDVALGELGGSPRGGAEASLRLDNERNLVRWESFRYAREVGADAHWHALVTSVLEQAIEDAPPGGLSCEFGVYQGLSLRFIAERTNGPVHGFDSFQGLPEAWKAGEGAGSYSAGNHLPRVPQNVTLHPGWFEETLPNFVADAAAPMSLLHIDCDIYSSTATVLRHVRPLLRPGTVVAFDEYLGYPGYREHEFRAWQEFAVAHGIEYEYLAFNLGARKAALRILGFGRER